MFRIIDISIEESDVNDPYYTVLNNYSFEYKDKTHWEVRDILDNIKLKYESNPNSNSSNAYRVDLDDLKHRLMKEGINIVRPTMNYLFEMDGEYKYD